MLDTARLRMRYQPLESVYPRVGSLSRTARAWVLAAVLAGAGTCSANAPAPERPHSGRTAAAATWLAGEVILDRTPLADAIAEMNHFDPARRVVLDPAIAAVKISGVYHAGDLELFATMVARLYGFRVMHRGGRIHLLAPASTLTALR
ncbi:MAG TPA: hypothetical protein VG994_05860 [Steroidobacteraceae bacterium]|nr:hypothetical protein [Steroidobacteraceae bacterium]